MDKPTKKDINLKDYNEEISLLGAILLDPTAIIEVVDSLTPDCFMVLEHDYIYKNIVDLYNENIPIDVSSLSTRLRDKKLLGIVGGNEYLSYLVKAVPTAAHIKSYKDSVIKNYQKSELAKLADRVKEKASDSRTTVSKIVEFFEEALSDLTKVNRGTDVVRLEAVLDTYVEKLEEDIDIRGIPSGYLDLDNLTGGWNNSDLIILAARPGMGKSSLVLNFANNAIRLGKVVLFFSLEMGKSQLMDRLVGSEAGVDSWLLRTKNLNKTNTDKVKEAIARLRPHPLFLDSSVEISVNDIKTAARRLKLKVGLDMIIIDYLSLMKMGGTANKVNQIADITRGLKVLAKELDIPIILLCQLSRACELRDPKNKRPQLIDLRDSGAIEQDADIVLCMYRHAYYYRLKDGEVDKTELLIRKNRNGESNRCVRLIFNKQLQRYEDESASPTDDNVVEKANTLD